MAPTALFTLPIDALRCYDLVLIAVLMLALDAVMLFWNTRGQQLSPTELTLLRQYNEHVVVVNRLNSVETFVEQSKAIRRMNTVKKQMQELAGASCTVQGLRMDYCGCSPIRWLGWGGLGYCTVRQWSACRRRRRQTSRSGSTKCAR